MSNPFRARAPLRAVLPLGLLPCFACHEGVAAPVEVGANCALPMPAGIASTVPDTPAFDAERAWADLERIVALGERPAGSKKLAELRDFLASELQAVGLTPVRQPFEDETPIGRIAFENLYADLPAAKDASAAPIVILCTHIDTKRMEFPFVGANDAGAGTAVLLELARVLARSGGERAVTYRLLFQDGEESVKREWSGSDNTYGSRHHVKMLGQEGLLPRVKACVLLDLVGDESLRLTQELNSDPELLGIFFAAAREIGLAKHVGAPAREIFDDHLSFIAANIRSVDLIDFENGRGNSYWHTAEDTLAHCSKTSLDAIGRIVLAGLPGIEAFARR